MIVVARRPAQLGGLLDDAWDAVEDVADAVTSAVKTLHDAGGLIGTILKTIAPAAAFIPGIGTGLAVAAYAAGAIAAADRIDEIVIGSASAAMPPGFCRIAFDSGIAIARDVAKGRSVLSSTLDACRSAAGQAGGAQAVAAFDAAVAAARGGPIDERALAALRAQVALGGESAALAFDAGVAVSRGESAPAVMLGVARQYIADSGGGPLGLAAFDTGVALAYGETLQAAGFVALKKFVKGGPGEQVVRFLEVVAEGGDVKTALVVGLGGELQKYSGTFDEGLRKLRPYVEAIKDDLSLIDWDPQALADAWGVAEPYVRAAQVVMQSGNIDELLLQKLVAPTVKSIGRAVVDAANRAADDASWALRLAANPGVPEICLRARDARARNSPAALNLEAQCAALSRDAAIASSLSAATTSTTTTEKSRASLYSVAVAPVIRPAEPPLPPRFVPPASAALTRAPPPPGRRPPTKGSGATTGVVVGTTVLAALAGLWFFGAD